jgi:hypothetical protein
MNLDYKQVINRLIHLMLISQPSLTVPSLQLSLLLAFLLRTPLILPPSKIIKVSTPIINLDLIGEEIEVGTILNFLTQLVRFALSGGIQLSSVIICLTLDTLVQHLNKPQHIKLFLLSQVL